MWGAARYGDRLVVTFGTHVSRAAGEASAAAVEAELVRDPRSVELVFDARRTQSYARGVRIAWQVMLMPHRDQLRSVVVLTHSAAVRFGAGLAALALGIPIFILPALPYALSERGEAIPRAAG